MKQQEAVSNKPQWRTHTENGTSDSENGKFWIKKMNFMATRENAVLTKLQNGGSVDLCSSPCGEEQELVTTVHESW